MGPALNAGIGIVQAMDKFKDGYWAKGIEMSLPSGLKPYFKAAELATRGFTDSKENPMPGPPPSGWDIGLQAAGFHTGSRADTMEAQQYVGARNDRLANRRELISDEFYKGVVRKDAGEMATAQSDMQAFNQENPTQPIRNVQGGIRNRLAALALGNVMGAGVSVSRQEFPSLVSRLDFARDSAMPGQ
jgi:hypothetical protein